MRPILMRSLVVRKKSSRLLFFLLLGVSLWTPLALAVPNRIITLIPSLGELVADLLNDDLKRMVGVSEFTNYPPALLKKESVGPYFKLNLEKIVSLKPDLVLATMDGNSKDQVLHLRELGIPVVVVRASSFSDIMDSIQLVSTAVGRPRQGDQMISQLKRGLDHFKARAQGRHQKKVLLQVGGEPLVVVGRGSFLHEALELIGAKNIYRDSSMHYPRPSLEDVVSRNPEIIVIVAMGQNLSPYYQMAKRWEQLPGLLSVKKGEIFVLPGDSLLRPSVRLLEGLSQLERVIYGEK